ncbi:MAG TPA: barstar family protein [Burkholderiales bacterium]|jgi:hypothetical protein|nr:barstar family protein [Burkholderiales bacterium]
MSKLAERLGDAARSGVYRVTATDAVEDAARRARLTVSPVTLAGGKAAWLEAFARALAFPDWFGGNWDALEDCLTDLAPGEGHLLLLRGAPAAPRDELGVLLDILDSTAGYWKSRGKPFFAVLVDPGRELELGDLYREA